MKGQKKKPDKKPSIYEKPPFHERFWWLPAAIMGAGIAVELIALYLRLTRA